MHNEEGNVRPLYLAIKETMDRFGRPYEIIFVNDASSDGTLGVCQEIRRLDPDFHYCDLAENAGENWARLAGVSKARGDVIVTIDGDFQNEPAFIPHLLRKIEAGYSVASGWRKNRKGGFWDRVLPSVAANFLISKVSGVPVHDCGCGLKAYRREVLENKFVPSGFMNRFSPVVFGIRPREFCEVEVSDRLRSYGKSHYGLKRIFIVFNDLLALPFILRGPKRMMGRTRLGKWGSAVLAVAMIIASYLYFWWWGLGALLTFLAFLAFLSIERNLARFIEAEERPCFKIREFV